MSLTVEEILANRTSSMLLDDEADILIKSGYIIDNSAPRRIRSNYHLIEHTLRTNPNALNLRDPAFLEGFEKAPTHLKSNMLVYIRDSGRDFSHLPTADAFKRSLEFSNLVSSKDSYEALVIFEKLNNPKMSQKDRVDCLERLYFIAGRTKDPEMERLLLDGIKSSTIKPQEMPDTLLTSPEIVESRLDLWDRNKTEAITQIFQASGYSPEVEKEFLRVTKCTSVEEYLATNVINTGRGDSDVIQLAAIRLFTYKKLHLHGIDDVDVHVCSYDITDPTVKGCFNHEEGYRASIEINAKVNTPIKKMAKIAMHEAEHAIQEYNIKNANIDKDADVDTYSKDQFLACYDSSYYKRNYNHMSFEYDAEFRAELENYRLKEQGAPANDKPNFIETLKRSIIAIASREKDTLSKIQSEVAKRYKLVRRRKDENESIDTLNNIFEKRLNELIQEGKYEEIVAHINESFSILKYQYNITPEGATKKTPRELVEGLDNATDEKEIAIYTGLIQSSTDITKDENGQKNIETYEKIVTMPNIPLDVRRTLKDVLVAAKNPDKYRSLAETPTVGRSA